MAKSVKAKKEKKKDFQKQKLKVGKTKAKADNFTDTSFKARSIAVLQQSLQAKAPTSSAQFNHHLGLLNHRSEAQRRDSLAHLVNALQTANIHNISPPAPISAILPKVQPLFRDQSGAVRTQVLRLLEELRQEDVHAHVGQMLLHAQAGMTHMSIGVRLTGVEVLERLLNTCPEEVVSCAGGWVTTLQKFKLLFRWNAENGSQTNGGADKKTVLPIAGWQSTSATAGKGADEVKLLSKALAVLSSFLEAGLVDHHDVVAEEAQLRQAWFPLASTWHYMIPQTANPFGYLNLFGAAQDDESRAYLDAEGRGEVFLDKFFGIVTEGLASMKKEGGNIGRAATESAKTLQILVNGKAERSKR